MTFVHDNRFPRFDVDAIDTEDGRRYPVPPDGRVYESVTTAIGAWDKDLQSGLDIWRERIGVEEANKITRQAARRGTSVHDIAERFLKNEEINPLRERPDVMELWVGMRPILEKGIGKVYLQESVLYSHRYKLAGRVDLIFGNGNTIVIMDFKTSAKRKKEEWIEGYKIQCAAYSFAFEEMYGETVHDNIILIGQPGRPQVFMSDPDKYRDHEFFIERESLQI